MGSCRFWSLTLALVGCYPSLTAAQQPPSYARQVKPFLGRYCLECHNGHKTKGDLNLETFAALAAGGKKGPVVIAGKPDDSRLVLQVEGKVKPTMPPAKARQPLPEEAALLRAWVAAGARDDSAAVRIRLPDIKPRIARAAPVTALAYHPGGKVLVAGGGSTLWVFEESSGDLLGQRTGLPGKVTGLAFRQDGLRLAVACGAAGERAEVLVYPVSASGLPEEKPDLTISAHRDLIHDINWSPDQRLLATTGYDRLIKLWDGNIGKEVRVLRDHSDAVQGLAFSPNGQLLASAAADRAVKVWDVATGRRLYTLGESTDWLYAVAWSPDGRQLAAGGVDKSIRVWEVTEMGGKLVHSVFAHEGPITRLIYSPDGKILYSLGEDGTLKAWEAARLVERKVFAPQAETVLALALRPDGRHLALGRYDGALVVLDEATGQKAAEPLPPKARPPQLNRVQPGAGQRGQILHLEFEGKFLDQATEVTVNYPGVSTRILAEGKTSNHLRVEATFPSTTPPGSYQLGLKGQAGPSATTVPIMVDLFSPVAETEPNDSPTTGQKVAVPATLIGTLGRPGDQDFFKFEAHSGQQLGIQVVSALGSPSLEPVLMLTDDRGHILAARNDGVLGYTFARAGTYALGIHDREYRGGPTFSYRLHAGDLPVVTSVFPLGLQQGTETEVNLTGVNLGKDRSVRIKAPPGTAPGTRLPVAPAPSQGSLLGNPGVVVGEFPEVVAGRQPGNIIPVPGTANGRIGQAGAAETWRFAARKGQRLILEVNARRLGSPLDSFLEILDAQEQPVPRAVLRCLAKTYSTFRDNDSAGSGIRIETWGELAINDFLYVGSELMRILALPKNPDDDCQFFSRKGQRLGFLDTTPTHHSLGTPMYKVAIHPPGITFPANGLPIFTLYYRNDDGGPEYAKDSRLFFDPPADGTYLVRIRDAEGQGGDHFAYRLTVRPPRPDFSVQFSPLQPVVWKGGAVPIQVTVDRTDDFEGAIDIRLEGMPAGFAAPATQVPEGENGTSLALWADAGTQNSAAAAPLRLVARAQIGGQEVVHDAAGKVPQLKDPGDLVVSTDLDEVTVQPGSQVRLVGKVERRQGFTGRVPLEVRGLPHGVRVLDIGLNGILITPLESTRTMVLYCEPWVKATSHPFVVMARNERTGAEHAARSVLLKVVEKK